MTEGRVKCVVGIIVEERLWVYVQWLHKILGMAWRSGNIPADWQKGLIHLIHKKGNRIQCKNCHDISIT